MFLKGFMERLLAAQMFQRHTRLLGRREVISWWESRRFRYNLMVGATGLDTTSLFVVSASVGQRTLGIPIGLPDPPAIAALGVIVYGLMANLCYTAGWIVELFIAPSLGYEEGGYFGQVAFTSGFFFSIALTLALCLCWRSLGSQSNFLIVRVPT
jgi:hypothetical protein